MQILEKGLLIAFEGIDGSGLTTHSKLLNEKLNKLGYKSIYTKEPTNNEIGILIQKIILDKNKKLDNNIIALLFAADRLYHLMYGDGANEGILSYISKNYIVISDRYKYSNMAYQGDDINWISQLNKFAIEADIIIYLDVPLDVALKRISMRSSVSIFENKIFLEKVKNRYNDILRLANKNGVKVVVINEIADNNREKSIDEVSEEILKNIINILRNFKK
ncbi:thymidylate kinase [Caldisphaera lagunensis DSM 15908]|uniref:Probable thymidylate kinase n=1 Tax=Caldisphaera lagunensis (strain DSM 15908 / JCM 11604 / ANMR 0165 / IC-154) TaxID=1056495 RepID=L0ABR7_CALLD|nr:thymidylate kinase [Caldisphaera lagunensis DSM 15908]